MSRISFDQLPIAVVLLALVANLAVGIGLGNFYFRSVWWTTRLLAEERRTKTALAIMLGRFTILGGLLTLASLEGALTLLVMTLGVLAARLAVVRTLQTWTA